jgi:hypothetical protein
VQNLGNCVLARSTPADWGGWFARIGEGEMKETNLNIFYHFGAAITSLYVKVHIGTKLWDVFPELYFSQEWITKFLGETEEYKSALKDSRASAVAFLGIVQTLIPAMYPDPERVFTQPEVSALINNREELEKNFEREYRNLSVFTVTPKGLYDTRLLIEKGEEKFLGHTRSVFTERVIYDLRQSGRCLAFEVPTAMAFHVMRAAESLIKAYYEVLAGSPWPYAQRDWGKYIAELEKLPNINTVITGRLKEIKNLNRNPLIHPEDVVSMEEAPIIFDLCNGVIYYMAEEIRKRP